MVGRLLRLGADTEISDFDGNTPLYCASAEGSYAEAKLLLEHGASIEAENAEGKTPDMSALENAYQNIHCLIASSRSTSKSESS